MKLSFDFDFTLTNPKYQELAKKFIALGAEVHITTSRKPNIVGQKHLYDNRQVFEIAQQVGIPENNIRFTSYVEKYKFLKEFDLHFDDDDEEEIALINEHPCKCIGVLIQD
ncbi:MAG: hypothetical protein H7Y10_03525 [Flavobacterium sp.]|nr:hypothetical protein [Flavobacterium sp.]